MVIHRRFLTSVKFPLDVTDDTLLVMTKLALSSATPLLYCCWNSCHQSAQVHVHKICASSIPGGSRSLWPTFSAWSWIWWRTNLHGHVYERVYIPQEQYMIGFRPWSQNVSWASISESNVKLGQCDHRLYLVVFQQLWYEILALIFTFAWTKLMGDIDVTPESTSTFRFTWEFII